MQFKTSLLVAAQTHIPSKKSRPNYSQPWITPELRRLVYRRNRAYKKWKNGGGEDLKAEARDRRREAQRRMRRAYWDYIDTTLSEEPTEHKPKYKRCWSYIKNQKSANIGVAPLIMNGQLLMEPREKADALNKQYQSAFSEDKTYTEEEFKEKCDMDDGDYPLLDSITITEEEACLFFSNVFCLRSNPALTEACLFFSNVFCLRSNPALTEACLFFSNVFCLRSNPALTEACLFFSNVFCLRSNPALTEACLFFSNVFCLRPNPALTEACLFFSNVFCLRPNPALTEACLFFSNVFCLRPNPALTEACLFFSNVFCLRPNPALTEACLFFSNVFCLRPNPALTEACLFFSNVFCLRPNPALTEACLFFSNVFCLRSNPVQNDGLWKHKNIHYFFLY
ncbi:hypothetical protein ACOMHN_055241 [Nucella lapillus]